MNTYPLKGIRVVELATQLACPLCGRMLAEWGADVIKVESPGGDSYRGYGILNKTPATTEENPYWEGANIGKRAITLNIKTESGMAAMHRLLAGADVFLTNNRTKSLMKNGLDYDSLKVRYPSLVVAQITGYGDKGPCKDDPGFDSTAFSMRTGYPFELQWKEYDDMIYTPGAMGDTITGTFLFGAVCAALLRSKATGQGDRVDAALYASGIWIFTPQLFQTLYGSEWPKEKAARHPWSTPVRTKDGKWLLISVTDWRQWPALCDALDHPELKNDERFTTPAAFTQYFQEFMPLEMEIIRSRNLDEWMERLHQYNIICATGGSFQDILTDAQALENGYIRSIQYGKKTSVIPDMPIHSAKMGLPEMRHAPLYCQHSEEVLSELGYSREEIQQMVDGKATELSK